MVELQSEQSHVVLLCSNYAADLIKLSATDTTRKIRQEVTENINYRSVFLLPKMICDFLDAKMQQKL